jgi:branched-chain amino acid aminotransferase
MVNADDKYVRVQVTRGTGPIGMSSDLTESCNWVFYVKDVDKVTEAQYRNGVSIVTTQRLRNTKEALDPNIKSGNYLNNILAFQAAMPTKAFESVMVDAKGFITEGTTSNIWIVKNGVAKTPPQSSDLLKGITRGLLFEIGQKHGIEIQEAMITPDELRAADEVFLTSSTREVLSVSSVDGKSIKSAGCGQMTAKLGQLYKEYVSEYCRNARDQHPL